QRMSCGYILCTVLLFVVVLLAVIVTGTILFMNHYHAPVTESPPLISTKQDDADALVTIEKPDGSRTNIFIDPNCPDYASNFIRLEGIQSSILHAISDHDGQLKSAKGQDRALLLTLADEVAKLSAHAVTLKVDYETLWKGYGSLGQELNALQSEQGRLIQLLSESQINMAKLVSSVSDVLDALQKKQGSVKSRLKADLQESNPMTWAQNHGGWNRSRPRDCFDIYMSGQQEDGIYSVFPTHYPSGFQVFCDMSTDGGGWTVFQRREDGSVNFFKGWAAYRDGFGKITGEHWLGLNRIHALTIQANYELRINMADFENSTAFAHYGMFGVGLFSVDPEEDGYPLTIADYSGTAGDSFLKHNGMKFTTKDRDNDQSENNCAAFYHGAWWYRNCHTSNLNGHYLKGHHTSYADGVEWSSWTGWQYSLKFSEMKIRPRMDED
uniref:Fibrinogen C domain containing 1 n=1 Tax=Latimeria chalumnae TaxID=7897 RepID=H3B8X9_LATCH